MITRSITPIFTISGIGFLTSTIWVCLSNPGITLEPSPLVGVDLIAQANVLFVNPDVEQAQKGNGSESAPFKTITQALQVAQPNTVIILAAGTYSTSSGEIFPLQLKQGVSIQGNPRTRGSNIVIQGGGVFLSPTFARQNITILGANQATLNGVTVTNPNPRGYGLWIESSNPAITDNTFTGNSHDGISITGDSAPTIRSNYFYQNGANGMTIYGTSRPEVRENVFEQTGFGINIAQKAAPILVGNRITQNRAGVVTQATARPVLRGNVIEGNKEDGLVAISTSQPDLGTKIAPGGNVFRQNGRYDINSSASSQVISAYGNQLVTSRTKGNIDLAGTTANPMTTPATQTNSNIQLAEMLDVTKNSPSATAVLATQSTVSSPSGGEAARATESFIEIPVPPPLAPASLPEKPGNPLQKLRFMTVTSSSESEAIERGNNQSSPGGDSIIEIPIPPTAPNLVAPPPSPSSSTSTMPVLQPAPILAAELLPVPSTNIPLGNTRNLPKVSLPGARNSAAGSPPLPPSRPKLLGLRYRVVVEADSDSKQALVRSLVPGAFRTFANGRVLMQVGAFSDRANAAEIQQMLSSKGLRATVEQTP